ncbi:Ig-like domain-containing protein, partial [Methanothrix sp.]|uniref:Ig-like domain-containing protein n=1 Tax=Methanothrix sp. TaxID=90426 RepID=UPI003C774CF1
GSTSGDSGSSYTYSTRATDPDGDRVKYTFDWGDGSTSVTSLVKSGSTASTSHTWTVPSGSTMTFSVRSKATDEKGLDSDWSSALSVTITGPASVNNPPATPSTPSGSTSGDSGSSYIYTTRATDPDGDRVKYTFDWGDGSTSVTSLVSSGSAVSTSHTWTVPSGSTRTFSVRTRATDEKGLDSDWSRPLSVTIEGSLQGANRPPATPSIPSGEISGRSGKTFSYVTKATDPDGDRVKYIFDWGDGSTSETSFVSSGTPASASHVWIIEPGTIKIFDIRAKAIDEKGAASGWSNIVSIYILADREDRPPTIPSKPSGPTSGISGVSYSYSTSSTDPDGDMIKYIFDWGDGSFETDFFPSGQTVTATHSWNVPAGTTRSYKVRALASDSRNIICPYPYWSEPLVVTIMGSGASVAAQRLSLPAEEDEVSFAETKEVVLNIPLNDPNYPTATQIEENESMDAQIDENESMDTQTEENESMDAGIDENESMDTQIEEDCCFAEDDTYTIVSSGGELRIGAPGVLGNDQYGNEKSLSVKSHTQPAHAADFIMNPDGSFIYTANQDYCGEDSFTYTIKGDCPSNEATVIIFVDCGLQNEEEVSLS